MDAHWGAEMVYDYFYTVHNRNSWDGAGGPLRNDVHVGLLGANAAWTGSYMRYGDGDACTDPLTSLDIAAHEIAHGMNLSSAWISGGGESGALNESLSDMWAACVEFWAAPEKQTWLLGEDVTLCDDAHRSMSNPSSFEYILPDVTSTYPNTYNGTGYYTGTFDNGGVHINSGVPNYWFYLLVSGGTDTNDNGDCYQVSGIGITKAAKIVYRAETVILASATSQTVTFNQFRNATITAASDLYGATSDEVAQVSHAWYAVGVGSTYQYPISGLSEVCSSNSTFTVSNTPAGATITWQVSPANLFATGSGAATSGTGNTAVVRGAASQSGTATLSFTVNDGCMGTVTVQKTLWVGVPTAPSVSYLQLPSPHSTYRVRAIPTNATYEWYVDNVLQPGHTGSSFDIRVLCDITKVVKCGISSSCGLSPFGEVEITGDYCPELFVYPKPGS